MRHLLLFILIIGFSIKSNAQEHSYGLKIGTVLGDLITDRSGMNVRTSVQVGFEYELRWEDWSFQPELMYSRQGETERGFNSLGERRSNTLKLDYVILPLMAKYYINKGFYAEAGPQFGLLINASYERFEGSGEEITDVSGNYRNYDLSANIGLGYLTDWGFSVGLRYGYGLINVLQVPTAETTSQRHSVYQFYMGYRF